MIYAIFSFLIQNNIPGEGREARGKTIIFTKQTQSGSCYELEMTFVALANCVPKGKWCGIVDDNLGRLASY